MPACYNVTRAADETAPLTQRLHWIVLLQRLYFSGSFQGQKIPNSTVF